MKTASKLLLLMPALGVLFAGCGTPKMWYRPNTPASQATIDKADCRLHYQTLVLGTPSVNIAVGNNVNANTGQSHGVVGAAIERGRYVDDCMMAKGYVRVPVDQIPLDQRTNAIP